jgi:hypothetical protein
LNKIAVKLKKIHFSGIKAYLYKDNFNDKKPEKFMAQAIFNGDK